MVFFGVFALPAGAVELPRAAQDILDAGGPALESVAEWTLEGVLSELWRMVDGVVGQPVGFAGRALLFLLLGCAAGILAGRGGWQRCVEAVTVLGFGAMSLSAMMELAEKVGQTAENCQTYLVAFIPVYSGAAIAGGQVGAATVYGTMFFAMSNFLAGMIRGGIIPVLRIYFCFAVSASVWGNAGMAEAARLFSRCLSWLLKGCGALFSLVLGLQTILAGNADSAALRVGRSLLSGAIPVVGDAAAAALSSSAAAVQLLKGSLALAALAALAAMFLPAFAQCALYFLAFSGSGIVACGSGQDQCGQICRNLAEGARLCAAVLVLYFFMVILSTALLLLTGVGGG